MRVDRAWVRLSSGRRLNLLDIKPDSWSDEDLATGLSRTYRWGGHSTWKLPLSVAQHSLTVLAIRQQREGRDLAPSVALRELLDDADEGILGFDCITPLKPHLGEAYRQLTGLLQKAIADRYGLPAWDQEDYLLHKRADRLAAITEARHVAGWSQADIYDEFGTIDTIEDDPLEGEAADCKPWEPWTPEVAAALFLKRLHELHAAVLREQALTELRAAYASASERVRRQCGTPVHGSLSLDLLVRAEAPDGEAWEGVVVSGERDADGAWMLDAEFVIFTTDGRLEGQLVTVHGWNCDVHPI